MHDDERRGEIDRAMKSSPGLAQAFHPAFRRGEREWKQDQECRQAYQRIRLFENRALEQSQVEQVIHADEHQQMRERVKERIQSQRATNLERGLESEERVRRRAGETERQQNQRGLASAKSDFADRLRGQVIRPRVPDNDPGWNPHADMNDNS